MWEAGVRALPTEQSQNIGFLSNDGPGLLKNHKATKPAFNVGPSSAVSEMPFVKNKQTKNVIVGPLWQHFLDPRIATVISHF